MYKRLFLFLVSIAIIAGIVYWAGFEEIVDAILSIPLEFFLLLLIIQIATMVLSALKWRLILRHSRVSFRTVLASTFVGYLVNNITPIGMAGGEPVKAYLLSKKEKIPTEKVFSSVIVDLFIEIAPIFLLSAVAIFLIMSAGISMEIAVVLVIASLGLLVLFALSIALVYNKRFSYKVISLFLGIVCKMPFLRAKAGKLRQELEGITDRFNDAIKKQMLDNYTLSIGTFISIIVWTLRILRVYIVFLALGIEMPIATVIIVEAVVIVLTFIPILPGGLGVWEGTSIALFVLLGGGLVSGVDATTVTLVDRIIFYLFPSVLGVFAGLLLGVDVFKLVEREVEESVDFENVSRVIGQ